MTTEFKRVPAIDKSFGILNLLAKSGRPLGISELSKALGYNKSTVFNMVHTMNDLGILETTPENRFQFGTALYVLGKTAGNSSELIRTVHPFLEKINATIKLSAFLGIRSGMSAVILDKVDSARDLRMSSDIGMRLPLLAGAGGTALVSQLPDEEIDGILSGHELKAFTPYTCTDKSKYKDKVMRVRDNGIALDREEYIEGIQALAVPIGTGRADLVAAVWAVGLVKQVPGEVISEYSAFLKRVAGDIEARFYQG